MLTRGETSSVARQTNKAAAKCEEYTTLRENQQRLFFLELVHSSIRIPLHTLTAADIHEPTQVAMGTGMCKHSIHLSQGWRLHSWLHTLALCLHVTHSV